MGKNKKYNSEKTLNQSDNNILVTVSLVAVLILATAGIISLWIKAGKSSDNNPPIVNNGDGETNIELEDISDTDHIFGNKEARIVLVEYSDLECPYCKTFHSTAKKLVEDYGGQVAWVYRHFPLDRSHPNARRYAQASECAAVLKDENSFWEALDYIYDNQPELDKLNELAQKLEIDENAFNDCVSSKEVIEKVNADQRSGGRAGVNSTPSNFLVDRETGKIEPIPGAYPLETIKTVVDEMLK